MSKVSFGLLSSILLFSAVAVPTTCWSADGYKVLHDFQSGTDGASPLNGTLIADDGGNLYGATGSGGTNQVGTIFKISPDGAEIVLYSLTVDNAFPNGTLLLDKSGNLYGTSYAGGGGTCYPFGCGTVFKLAADGTLSTLHGFIGGNDGSSPLTGLVADSNGNLFGTTYEGGDPSCDVHGCGTIYKIAPDGTETILHVFEPEQDYPSGGLLLDGSGNLFGTTCGSYHGSVFKLTGNGNFKALHLFSGSDGSCPQGDLISDKAGNLYGTTASGGSEGHGAVFKVARDGSETTLYSFTGKSDGGEPVSGVVMDGTGDIYGTTISGGNRCTKHYACGVVFELSSTGTEAVLHDFSRQKGWLANRLLLKRNGALYGTTERGGMKSCGHGCGVVFQIK